MDYTLSAFADEIADDLEQQIDILQKHGIHHIELRGVWGKNVLDLSDAEIALIRRQTGDAGMGFSAIGSPIGKVPIDAEFQLQLDAMKRALEIADRLDAPFIRAFSFYPPPGSDFDAFLQPVADRLAALVELAEDAGRILAHENEKEIFGDTGDRCLALFREIDSPAFAAVFDFANFVQCGQQPYRDAWGKLRDHVVYFHIKDALLKDGTVVPAGQGDGDIARILHEAFSDGFAGFLVLEPHLSVAESHYGRTQPELFATAVQSLQQILDSLPNAQFA
ncbi:MAG TPA: sugar phosphate isomerase/epimerase family protein [bacterium]|nr:sugar phosphate isomerase/epimerase family protein [bacterium]HNT64969.1 sugar phosphate isomerase/epimerase family protein [bacterium]